VRLEELSEAKNRTLKAETTPEKEAARVMKLLDRLVAKGNVGKMNGGITYSKDSSGGLHVDEFL
jgi:hypothetical protein